MKQRDNVITRQFGSRLFLFCFLLLTASFVGCARPPTHHRAFAGGYSRVPVTDHDVMAAANFAVAEQARRTSTPLHLVAIVSAEQQVVAGINYRLSLIVQQSTKTQPVRAVVFRDLKSHFSLSAWDLPPSSSSHARQSHVGMHDEPVVKMAQ
jgi:hypothetical protein